MTTLPKNRLQGALAGALLLSLLLPAPALAISRPRRAALTQFQTAEKMREALNGLPASQRSERDYQRVVDAYRKVYFTSASSARADTSIMAVAELLTEMGRVFKDEKRSREAIRQYQFLVKEYPTSKLRYDAVFTVGQVYKDDLNDPARAREAFQSFLKFNPRNRLAPQAREALAELDRPAAPRMNAAAPSAQAGAGEVREVNHPQDSSLAARARHGGKLPLMTNVRHWSTPDYTRVAIDLEEEVKYEAGRVSSPDRIFFDLHDTKLASTLAGKSFDVEDGFLHRIRLAQYTADTTRIVLDVDEVSEYSAFFLPNPYRLIVDIHGKVPEKTLVAEAPAARNRTPAKDAAVKDARAGKPAGSSEVFPTENTQPANPGNQAAANEGAGRDISPMAPVDVTSPTGHANKKSKTTKPASGAPATPPVTVAPPPVNSQAVEVAAMTEPGVKDTAKPTTKPTFESVSPRSKKRRSKPEDAVLTREAQPTAEGERSLVRALGLKISRIVVDAGHGGHDTGTIGPNGLQEKDLVLDVALRLGKLLEGRMGADVIYTRDDDTFIPLESRTGTANRERADLFISIHANSSRDAGARGVETYYLNFTSSRDALEVAARENAVSETSIHELQDLVKKIALKDKIDESREFAMDVQNALYLGIAGRRSGIRDRGVKKAPFVVLIGANMPSILAEISFVSNPEDEKRLQTPLYRQKIAESLYRGVLRYASGLSGVKVASKTADSPGQ